MEHLDPVKIASLWHDGQSSALYAYASTGRIPSEDFKHHLVGEIERAMGHADDQELDQLEYLLMHVEEEQPELGEDSMREEALASCETCGGKKNACECSMMEGDFGDWFRSVASKVKDIAMTDVGGPEGVLTPADRAARHGTPRKAPGDDFKKWKEKQARKSESVLRAAIHDIVAEMKLSVAGRTPFHFGGASEVDADDVDLAYLKKKEDAPPPPASGVKKKAKPVKKSKKA